MAAKNVGSVAMAIGQWLTDSGLNLNRPIRSLTKEELLGIAWEAIGQYNDCGRSWRSRGLRPPQPRRS